MMSGSPEIFEQGVGRLPRVSRMAVEMEAAKRQAAYSSIILPNEGSRPTRIRNQDQAQAVLGLEAGYLYMASVLRLSLLRERPTPDAALRIASLEDIIAMARTNFCSIVFSGDWRPTKERWERRIREAEQEKQRQKESARPEQPQEQRGRNKLFGKVFRLMDEADRVAARFEDRVASQERRVGIAPLRDTKVTKDVLKMAPNRTDRYQPFDVDLGRIGLPAELPITVLF